MGCFWSGYLVDDISSLVCNIEDNVLNLPTAVGISCQYFAKEIVITPSSRWMVSTWVANMEVEQYPQEYLEATIIKKTLGGAATSRLKSKLLLEVEEHYYMFHMECESKSSCILKEGQEAWEHGSWKECAGKCDILEMKSSWRAVVYTRISTLSKPLI